MPTPEELLKQADEQRIKLETELVETRAKIEALEKEHRGVGEKLESQSKLINELTEKIEKRQGIEEMKARLDQVEKRMEVYKFHEDKNGIDTTEHRDAVRAYIACGGRNELLSKNYPKAMEFFNSDGYRNMYSGGLERRDLWEGLPSAGGVFITPDMDSEIVKNITEIGAMRTVSGVRTGNSPTHFIIRRTGVPTASWVGEKSSASESASTYGNVTIVAHALSSVTDVTEDMLMDVPQIEGEIQADASEQFANSESLAFVYGTGVNQPKGIMLESASNVLDITNVGTTVSTTSGTNVIAADNLPAMYSAIHTVYANRGSWLFNRNSLGKIMALKATSGNYLWQPGLQLGVPATLLGRPFYIDPNFENEGSDTFPILFGDFQTGYRIYDRIGITLKRDDFTQDPAVRFVMRKRVGGQVRKPECFVALLTT